MDSDMANDNEVKDDNPGLKEIIDFIKEYLPVIIIVPAILGGLWQLIVLWSFGLSYIRFFSLSQLVSDGLIVLVFFPLVLLATKIVVTSFNPMNYKIIDKKKDSFFLSSFVIIIGLFFIVRYYYFTSNSIPFKSIFFKYIFPRFSIENNNIFLLFCSVTVIFNSIKLIKFAKLYSRQSKILSKRNINNKKSIKSWFKNTFSKIGFRIMYNFFRVSWVILLMIISPAIYVYFSLNLIFSTGEYYKPKNLVNISFVEASVQEKYKLGINDFEVSYFNDNYIFITHYTQPQEIRDSLVKQNQKLKKEILILKSESFFDITDYAK